MAQKRKAEKEQPEPEATPEAPADWTDEQRAQFTRDALPMPEEKPAVVDEDVVLIGDNIHVSYPDVIVRVEGSERAEFIDRAAIAIYANGWPLKTVYLRARQLWEQRQKEGGP